MNESDFGGCGSTIQNAEANATHLKQFLCEGSQGMKLMHSNEMNIKQITD